MSETELDLHGQQIMVHETTKILKERANLKTISINEWERYYSDLRYEFSDLTNPFNTYYNCHPDDMTMEMLEDALEKVKFKKACV